MPKYTLQNTVLTRTGGVGRMGAFCFEVEADSMEEAVARFRSACARLINRGNVSSLKHPGEYQCTTIDGHFQGSAIVESVYGHNMQLTVNSGE